MTMVSIRVDLDELATAVANQLKSGKRRGYNAAVIASVAGIPAVTDAIAAVIAATDKVDNAQHTRGENAAKDELFSKAKQLRMAVRTSSTFEKETKQ